MKIALVSAVIAAMALSQNASAGNVQPSFDLTGVWQPASGGSASFFQEGTQVTFVNVNSSFAHYFVGRYITPTKVEGIQHRVNRSDGCSTEMLLVFTAKSSDLLSVSGLALDSNCDLVKGQKYPDSAGRIE